MISRDLGSSGVKEGELVLAVNRELVMDEKCSVSENSPLLQEHSYLQKINVDPIIHDSFINVEGMESDGKKIGDSNY